MTRAGRSLSTTGLPAWSSPATRTEPTTSSPRSSGGLGDIGYTVPGQAWTYWNRGPGPGDDYLDSEEGHEWSHSTGKAAAANLLAVAKALAVTPIPAPPSE